ncbi:MAG: hypothetical protein Q7K33_01045 [Candidatus Berkelbacteria bacterium]|nr:hypothetical protein [Candidatus Berkelbacteria bacterium]
MSEKEKGFIAPDESSPQEATTASEIDFEKPPEAKGDRSDEQRSINLIEIPPKSESEVIEPPLAKALRLLLKRYANREDSDQHYQISHDISSAVRYKDAAKLIDALTRFGMAQNKVSSGLMRGIEADCAKESSAIIEALKAADQIPWDDLWRAVGYDPQPVPVPEALNEDEVLIGEQFLEQFINNNPALSNAARDKMIDTVRIVRGPWHVIGLVESVVEEPEKRRVVVKNNSRNKAMSFFYY